MDAVPFTTLYKNFFKEGPNVNLIDVFNDIKNGKYISEINTMRYALHKEDKGKYDELKQQLPAFTPSATFGDSRTQAHLLKYSGIVHLDYDHVPPSEMQGLIKKVNECEYTCASFISPSNEGIKVFVKVKSNQKQHSEIYQQVSDYYNKFGNVAADKKCKDITRLCFVSYDEDLYLNESSKTFELVIEEKPKIKERLKSPKPENKQLPTPELLERCLKFTEQKETYHDGNRNNFIYLFASNANRFGIQEADAYDYCYNNFDLDEPEIRKSLESAYKNHSADFAKFAYFANKAEVVEFENKEKQSIDNLSLLSSTPLIPESVYKSLPVLFQKGAEVINNDRERDVFLTGVLTIISGCLPEVRGVYGGKEVCPNLFSFLLAPPASGKGSLVFAKILADKYHKATVAGSDEAIGLYNKEMEAYKHQKKYLKKGEQPADPPIEPPFKVVYIPANTSNAKIIKHLQDNEGFGIICETEADTLGQTFKNDWGSYSDLLRKAYHHEKISISRKTNNEYFEIDDPRLSVVLSGTPNQILNIIQSAEDGLFSRFMYYVFASSPTWLDPSPKSNPVNLTEHFKSLSNYVYDMVKFLDNSKTNIHLTDEQWDKFNPIFDEYIFRIYNLVSEDATSVVKRLGLIVYRLCMIFTAMRKYESQIHDMDVQCLDLDFDNALTLAEVYLQHSLLVFKNLPKQGEHIDFKPSSPKSYFYNQLPNEFERKQAIEIGAKIEIKERTVDNHLAKLEKAGYLSKPKAGYYIKQK